jgi:hypothetical protein
MIKARLQLDIYLELFAKIYISFAYLREIE